MIVGEGPIKSELEEFIKMNRLDNVVLAGFQKGKKLIDLIANAQFVVVPSEWYENSPFVIYEPFCLGTPVLGARIGGIPEFITEGWNGWLFSSGDADELSKKLNLILNAPEELTRMGKNAREFAENNFTAEIHYDKITEIYNKTMKNGECQRGDFE